MQLTSAVKTAIHWNNATSSWTSFYIKLYIGSHRELDSERNCILFSVDHQSVKIGIHSADGASSW